MQTFWKTVWPYLLKLKTHTHFDLVISLLTIYPTEIKKKKPYIQEKYQVLAKAGNKQKQGTTLLVEV